RRMESRNGFRHTYTGKAEIQIAKWFFRTVHRSGGVRHVLIVSIPGIRIPIADPLHAVIRHVIDTQRVGWQAAAHWNTFSAFPDLLVEIAVEMKRPPVMCGKDPFRAASIPCFELPLCGGRQCQWQPDRKSTRLNSSHVKISYAVFCLKK